MGGDGESPGLVGWPRGAEYYDFSQGRPFHRPACLLKSFLQASRRMPGMLWMGMVRMTVIVAVFLLVGGVTWLWQEGLQHESRDVAESAIAGGEYS